LQAKASGELDEKDMWEQRMEVRAALRFVPGLSFVLWLSYRLLNDLAPALTTQNANAESVAVRVQLENGIFCLA
jgi:hypothetical protein